MLNKIIRFFLENKLVVVLLLVTIIGWGITTAPFDMDKGFLPNDPVPVDAIPDIGDNQQIIFTKWPGRSPQDIEDQITYPLTSSLLGIPGVKSIRSNSVFGFSSIYLIFNDDTEYYWSRSRILEKLNSLPSGTLPKDAQPKIGPDATALGQIFWYTLEGRDSLGNVTGGWDLEELRTIQDFYVKYGLSSAEGVSEVASIGGYVKEYQVDIDPDAMKANDVTLEQLTSAVKNSNLDVGAQTLEINRVEYFIRGLGYIKNLGDLEKTVVKVTDNVPIYIGDIAHVTFGPATRRGVLDKDGSEVVGGVVVTRFGANPMEVINNVKGKINELAPGLPIKTLSDGTQSQVTVIPFYDRTDLIKETIGTLQEALWLEILVTIIVIIVMVTNLRASILISGLLPVAVLMTFIAMRHFGVDANIVALSGIAIAIGTMVDMGIVLSENILRHLDKLKKGANKLEAIYTATTEVASAILTAIATTIVSFIPVFALEAAEGKMFRPLAFTKTFALVAAIIIAITVIPAFAHWLFSIRIKRRLISLVLNILLAIGGLVLLFIEEWMGVVVLVTALAGLISFFGKFLSRNIKRHAPVIQNLLYASIVAFLLTRGWMPLGVQNSLLVNFIFVLLVLGVLLGSFKGFIYLYPSILKWCLQYKWVFLALPVALVVSAIFIMRDTSREFMPSLDEGSFLLMPSSMLHSGMEENIEIIKKLDMAVGSIPEVEVVVGKMGRVESPLDPAPISMFENVINYKSEYITNNNGFKQRFKTNKNGEFLFKSKNGDLESITNDQRHTIDVNALIPDRNGQYFRQWRDKITSPDDIWDEIVRKINFPGITSPPKLQPIETRLLMLQTGMRAPIGIKVKGPDLKTIEQFGLRLENELKKVEGVKKEAVYAERIIGKPYIEIQLKRDKMARYGLNVSQVQNYLEVAVGGITLTQSVEGRERFPIRVRYPRELRDHPDEIKNILIPTSTGDQLPLSEIVEIRYESGPQSIKSEDGFLVGYVLLDKMNGYSEVDVVQNAQLHLEKVTQNGTLKIPKGVSYRFAGNYENQVRATARLNVVIPIALMLIFLILYFEFKSVAITSFVFSGVFVAFSGGFIMIWLYDQSWFLNFSLFDTNMRDLFQMKTVNLSVAVWVGFLALFGIATDDGVLVATYLKKSLKTNKPQTIEAVRTAVVQAGKRRVKPAMMTTATTILALMPVLTSSGKGSDIMVPMAIPSVGGMTVAIISMFVVPVLYCMWEELKLKKEGRKIKSGESS
jgi:copper/silver efflux system protein